MNAIQCVRALGPIDVRGVRRDSTLPWLVAMPLATALILRWGLPPLSARLLERYGFDLAPYTPALLAYFFVVLTPLVFGTLIGFLLLDEKDDATLTALQVTPLSLDAYLAYRITVPVALTFLMLFIIFPLSRLAGLPWTHILVTAVAAAPLAPLFALYLAALAQNKVQGFALMKLSGFLLLAPVAAFFAGGRWELAFGLIPTYWPMKVYWLLAGGETGRVWAYVLAALLYQSAVTALLVKRFNTVRSR